MATVFAGAYGEGVEINVTTSSSSTAFTANKGNVLKLTNAEVTATNLIYVRVGTGTQTAVDEQDVPIAGGETVYLAIDSGDNNIGAIASGGSGLTLSAIPGYVRSA